MKTPTSCQLPRAADGCISTRESQPRPRSDAPLVDKARRAAAADVNQPPPRLPSRGQREAEKLQRRCEASLKRPMQGT